MSDFIVAQAVGEYVGVSSLVEMAQQTWAILYNSAANLDFTTWLIMGAVVLVVVVLWGLRPPI